MDFSTWRKKFFIFCLLFMVSFGVFAQQNHFIYLQTENNQLFYVRLSGKIFSSSSAGYLIIPGLSDGTLELTVGFPKNEFPEEKFDIRINNKNEGFLLKNMNEKGWVLFNLQSLAIIEKTSVESQAIAVKPNPLVKEDTFTSLLANAVNDSSLFQQNNIISNQQQPKQANQVVNKNDSLSKNLIPLTGSVNAVSTNSPHESNDTITKNVASIPVSIPDRISGDTTRIHDSVYGKGENNINKILDVNQPSGIDMVYTVRKPSGVDTVRIFIPANGISNSAQPAEKPNSSDITFKSTDSTLTITPTVVPPDYMVSDHLKNIKDSSIINFKDSSIVKSDFLQEKREDNSQLNDKIANEAEAHSVNDKIRPDNQIILLPQAVTSSEVNSDCNSFATDQDFLKVRKKMAAATGMENMVDAARKFFKLKCYSTEQIKNLSYLFLSEEGKYLFFDMAYQFTSDSNLYETLQSQFKDTYYLNRFKAMIRK